jgi:hypothetical protein
MNAMKKMNKIKLALFSLPLFAVVAFTSCENDDTDFDDFEYTTTYFPYQTPIRTLVLGNDENVDVTTDNAHQCRIYAMIGGARDGRNATIDIAVDNTLCNNLYFSDGTAVKAMPESYYTLESNQIKTSGINGYVTVQLTDAFFADTANIAGTYVIPLVMTGAQGVDSILVGSTPFANAVRTNSSDWDVVPKDYVLYMVKFICPWAGNYLRRGVDVTTTSGSSTTTVRHNTYVEDDEVVALTTKSLHSVLFPVSSSYSLLITFDDSGNGTITSATNGYTITGTATFGEKTEKKAWGNKDRDAIYMDYTVSDGTTTIATKDTLVARDRGISGTVETFSTTYEAN